MGCQPDQAAFEEAPQRHAGLPGLRVPAIVVRVGNHKAGEHEEEVHGQVAMIDDLPGMIAAIPCLTQVKDDDHHGRDAAQAVEYFEVLLGPDARVWLIHDLTITIHRRIAKARNPFALWRVLRSEMLFAKQQRARWRLPRSHAQDGLLDQSRSVCSQGADPLDRESSCGHKGLSPSLRQPTLPWVVRAGRCPTCPGTQREQFHSDLQVQALSHGSLLGRYF